MHFFTNTCINLSLCCLSYVCSVLIKKSFCSISAFWFYEFNCLHIECTRTYSSSPPSLTWMGFLLSHFQDLKRGAQSIVVWFTNDMTLTHVRFKAAWTVYVKGLWKWMKKSYTCTHTHKFCTHSPHKTIGFCWNECIRFVSRVCARVCVCMSQLSSFQSQMISWYWWKTTLFQAIHIVEPDANARDNKIFYQEDIRSANYNATKIMVWKICA